MSSSSAARPVLLAIAIAIALLPWVAAWSEDGLLGMGEFAAPWPAPTTHPALLRAGAGQRRRGLSIVFANEVVRRDRSLVRPLVEGAAARAGVVLPLEGVTIRVGFDPDSVIPEWGVGGYTPDGRDVELSLTPGRQAEWERWVPRIVVHEWHHLARWRGPGYGTTAFEALLSEGLAQHFEVEIYPGPPAFYTHSVAQAEVERAIATLKAELDRPDYDHGRWFFGTGDFAYQTGYTLGYQLVRDYRARVDALPSALVGLTPTDVMRTLGWDSIPAPG